jgi:hypothetical protein
MRFLSLSMTSSWIWLRKSFHSARAAGGIVSSFTE